MCQVAFINGPAAMEAVEAHDMAEQDNTKPQESQSWAEARVLCLTASRWRSVYSLLAGWLCESSSEQQRKQQPTS